MNNPKHNIGHNTQKAKKMSKSDPQKVPVYLKILVELLIINSGKSGVGDVDKERKKGKDQYGCFESCQFRPRSVFFVS